MSSILLEKQIRKNWTDLYDHFKPKSFDASEVILPYSKLTEKFIYTGNEKIPFNQRNPIYQLILKKEFTSALKEIY